MQREKIICIYQNLLWDEIDDCEYYDKANIYISTSINYLYDSEEGKFKVNKKELYFDEIMYLQIGQQIVVDDLFVHIGDKLWILLAKMDDSDRYPIITGVAEKTVTSWQQVTNLLDDNNHGRFTIYTYKCIEFHKRGFSGGENKIIDEFKLKNTIFESKVEAEEVINEFQCFTKKLEAKNFEAEGERLSYIYESQKIF